MALTATRIAEEALNTISSPDISELACEPADASLVDPIASAQAAGLRYVHDALPGILRVPGTHGHRENGKAYRRER
jgi:2-methylcitrate dehydratase PrpD